MGKNRNPKISRRRFAQVTAVAAAATMAPAALFSQAEKPSQSVAPSPQGKPLTQQQEAEAQAQAANILRKYGSRLNDAQRADILRQLREGQKPLAELRAYPLENAECPATVLQMRPRSSGA